MKKLKIILPLFLIVMIFHQHVSFAGNKLDSLFNANLNSHQYQYIPLNHEAIEALAPENDELSPGEKAELAQVVNNIKDIKILTTDANGNKLYTEVLTAITTDNFVPYFNVNDGTSDVNFYTDIKGQKVQNLLILIKDLKNCILLSISGNIDMDQISTLAQNGKLHIPGLDKLKVNAPQK